MATGSLPYFPPHTVLNEPFPIKSLVLMINSEPKMRSSSSVDVAGVLGPSDGIGPIGKEADHVNFVCEHSHNLKHVNGGTQYQQRPFVDGTEILSNNSYDFMFDHCLHCDLVLCPSDFLFSWILQGITCHWFKNF